MEAVDHHVHAPGAPRSGLRYPRVLLKLSGEALAGDRTAGPFDFDRINFFCDEIKTVGEMGAQVGLVIGGGNIVRGSQLSKNGMDRVGADYMGMLGTVINALALQDVLERKGVDTRVMTAIRMEELAEPFIRRRAIRHLEKGRAVIFAAGTGNPYFTTDSAAALRANEIHADILLKATKVDGLYTADPEKDPDAVMLPAVTYQEVLEKDLKVMDTAAISLCRDNGIPIAIFDLMTAGNIRRVVCGERVGSIVRA